MALRQTDRILTLAKIEPKGSVGLFDPAVFEGKNDLHVVLDTSTLMWSFRYTHGVIPSMLKGNFSSFKAALEHAGAFFANKNIKITGIKD